MEDVIYKFIHDHLYMHVILIVLAFAGTLTAMGIDLIFGVKKAKERQEARTSTGYKKTSVKAQKYFSPMLCLTVIDVMSSIVIPIPAFTMMWAAYCIFCEFKSVREKSWEKAEILKAQKTMSVVIENKEDIAKLVSEFLFNNKDKDEEKNENNENN